VAEGSWKVVYAPHMTMFANLLMGEFEVQYDLKNGGTMTSKLFFDSSILQKDIHLSSTPSWILQVMQDTVFQFSISGDIYPSVEPMVQ